ncbi:MAG: hypothetical protein IPF52_12935 [Saprospiraceae bacterium]|nr:hypothetical protein [Saprospiraceae bacterium]
MKRNGNSDTKAFQLDTLERMFQHLKDNNISRIDKFRADAASYQYDVVKLVEKTLHPTISGPETVMWKNILRLIEDWIKTKDQTEKMFI